MSLQLKTIFTTALFLLVSMFASINVAMATENKVVTLDIPGMTCKFCPITIRKALEKVPGVSDVKSEFENKTATVTYDPTVTNIETLTKTTANAGYPSTLKK